MRADDWDAMTSTLTVADAIAEVAVAEAAEAAAVDDGAVEVVAGAAGVLVSIRTEAAVRTTAPVLRARSASNTSSCEHNDSRGLQHNITTNKSK